MIKKSIIKLIALIIGFIGYYLAYCFYDWKLILILILVIWANNMERK
tara:strand:- start:1244 stop:1384 length:141 start_codon:yes stop_codon:yes gene_type:complete